MIQRQTRLVVLDNSGVQEVLCIGIEKSRTVAFLGDKITVVVKKTHGLPRVSVGEIVKALVVSTTWGWTRADGRVTFYGKNGVILLKKNPMTRNYLPLGTRILQPLSQSLKYLGYHRLLSLSSKWI